MSVAGFKKQFYKASQVSEQQLFTSANVSLLAVALFMQWLLMFFFTRKYVTQMFLLSKLFNF